MFNLLLALFTGLIIGWNFHSFFTQLNPPKILSNNLNMIKKIEATKIAEQQENNHSDEKNITNNPLTKKEKIPERDSFFKLLKQDQFSEAMSLYLDADNQQLITYHSTLLRHFKTLSITSPKKSILQMLEFCELESQHQTVSLILIKTYNKIKAYKEAIEVLTQLHDNASASEIELIQTKLIQISESYISELNSSKDLNKVNLFLKERIEVGIKTPFYRYALAQYYTEIEQYALAIPLLKEIEFDYDYGNKAKNLLNKIKKKITQNQEYNHKINLKKIGEHFSIEVKVNNVPITLLLDTGATLTLINENKLSSLTLIKENITLNTAGGEITAQLQEVSNFSVGEIELKKFQIVSSSFEQEKADGLLGMNFFKKFKFKIDQDKALLYLSEKAIKSKL